MEGMSGKEGCTYKGQSYAHGSELCVLRRWMICVDGKWQDKKLFGPSSPVP
jgi:hypothetical protein